MIPTRVHAKIDWVAVFGVEFMGRCGLFSRRVQDLFKGSARVHAVYAAATDYKLGARGHVAGADASGARRGDRDGAIERALFVLTHEIAGMGSLGVAPAAGLASQ